MDYIKTQQKITTEKLFRRKKNGMDKNNINRLKEAFGFFDGYTDKNLPFLDIGSRCGWFMHYLIEMGYKNVQGIDISLDAVNWMKKDKLIVQQMDAHDMNLFVDNSFGSISIIHVLEHCPYPNTVINELYRVLKLNGILYVEIPLEKIPKIKSGHFYSFVDGKELTTLFKDKFKILCYDEMLPLKSIYKCVLEKI